MRNRVPGFVWLHSINNDWFLLRTADIQHVSDGIDAGTTMVIYRAGHNLVRHTVEDVGLLITESWAAELRTREWAQREGRKT
jgi:hypothetical protein